MVNENSLIKFLKLNKNAKYYTDVLSSEINNKFNSPIFQYFKRNNQILITPHIGGMTIHAQEIAYYAVADKLISFCN